MSWIRQCTAEESAVEPGHLVSPMLGCTKCLLESKVKPKTIGDKSYFPKKMWFCFVSEALSGPCEQLNSSISTSNAAQLQAHENHEQSYLRCCLRRRAPEHPSLTLPSWLSRALLVKRVIQHTQSSLICLRAYEAWSLFPHDGAYRRDKFVFRFEGICCCFPK